ncbi:MAG: DUF4230 domain-containing protein, partial [Muribaculaceae bacterium]|nr:DUF4230 domain-containing protein [Muribaculaceae bacterium]
SLSCGHKEEPVDVYSRLQDVSRLELSSMTVGKVGMITDPAVSDASGIMGKAEAMIDAVKVGQRIGVYSYDTYLTAYIDLSELAEEDVDIDRDAGTAHVILPPVRVMVDGREPELHEEHYRVTGLRSSITPEERARLKSQMAREVRKELAADRSASESLRSAAEAKAKAWFGDLLENWGYDAVVEIRR